MIKFLSLFSGVGSPEMALRELGIDFELVGFSEIDKFAISSYCKIHGVSEDKNLGDITKINVNNLPKNIDLITHGSPCQDFSVAGNNLGGDEGSNTRSSLMWNTVEVVKHCKPKYVIWENVKNVLSKKHKHNFDRYIKVMENAGYKNYHDVLNAKNYGVPQNRERVFVVSIREDIEKDFKFPKGYDTGIRLRDILEDVVDEKYYISQEKAAKIIKDFEEKEAKKKSNLNKSILLGNVNPSGRGINGSVYSSFNVAPTVTTNKGEGSKILVDDTQGFDGTRFYEDSCPTLRANRSGLKVIEDEIRPCIRPDKESVRQNGRRIKDNDEPMFTLTAQDRHGIVQIGLLDMKGNEQVRRVYDSSGISPTLNTMQGGNKQPKVIEPMNGVAIREATKKGYAIANVGDSINLEQPNSKIRRGRVGKGVANTLTTSPNQGILDGIRFRIRKLTPLECWRLMGFKDSDFFKAKSVCSDSQLYKQAGNSIVKHVLMGIFRNLYM